MTGEEMERAITFLLEQQAQLNATVGTIAGNVGLMAEKVDLMAENIGRLTEKVDLMAESIGRLTEKVDRNAESATALLAIAEIHDREIKETNERLNALISTVERHISEGRNGKA